MSSNVTPRNILIVTPDCRNGMRISCDRIVRHLQKIPGLAVTEVQAPLQDRDSVTFDLIMKRNTELYNRYGVTFDLIHGFYGGSPGFNAVYAARYLKIPSVLSLRGNDVALLEHTDQLAALQFAIRNATTLTALSRELIHRAQILANPPTEQRWKVIRNSVDPADFEAGPALPYEGARPLIGAVGHWYNSIKGLEDLAEAYSIVRKSYKNASLMVIGTVNPGVKYKFSEKIANLVDDKGVEHVFMLGDVPHSQLLSHIKRFDVGVVPSRQDANPQTLLELMLADVTPVATDTGSNRDVTPYPQYIAEPGNPQDLAEKIISALEDGRATPGMLSSYTRQVFSPEIEANNYYQTYKELLEC